MLFKLLFLQNSILHKFFKFSTVKDQRKAKVKKSGNKNNLFVTNISNFPILF